MAHKPVSSSMGATATATMLTLLVAGSALLAANALACKDDLPRVGYLGITELDCNCSSRFSMNSRDGRHYMVRSWIFRNEPRIGGIDSDGPSAGKLREDDVITAVDGKLITTSSGSERFSRLQPGQVVTLTIRRESREMPVKVTVGSICPEELSGSFSMWSFQAPENMAVPPAPPAPGAPPAPPAPMMWMNRGPSSQRVLPLPDVEPGAMPRGWLGVGFTCRNCGGEVPDSSTTPVWSFQTLPTIYFVDPDGPAARAGLRRGDVLAQIDGLSLLSEQGGKRFGSMQPGQSVSWTVLRDGSPRTLNVIAASRPDENAPEFEAYRQKLEALREMRRHSDEGNAQYGDLERQLRDLARVQRDLARVQIAPTPSSPRRLRYAGSVAGSDVEVRGLGSVVVDDSGDEIVITTRDATIRIKPSAKPPDAKDKSAKK